MRIVVSLLVGILAYFLAHIVFNEPISALLGVLAGLSTFYGYDKRGTI